MGQILQVSILSWSLATLLLLEVKNFEASAAISISSSSSSQYGSSCNGLVCPPHTNCAASTYSVNGNSTSDKKCTTYNGVVVRQETVTVRNGEMCIRNLTLNNNGVDDQHNCRKLSDEERNQFYNQGSYPAMNYAYQHQPEALGAIIGHQKEYMEKLNENLSKVNEKKKLALEKMYNYRQKMLELRKQQLEQNLEARKESYENYLENMQAQAEAKSEQLELQQEAKMMQMENAREMLERRAEMLANQKELQAQHMEKTLEAMELSRGRR